MVLFRYVAAQAQVEALIEALAVELALSKELAQGFGVTDLDDRRERLREAAYRA
jgi:hypothetical protein